MQACHVFSVFFPCSFTSSSCQKKELRKTWISGPLLVDLNQIAIEWREMKSEVSILGLSHCTYTNLLHTFVACSRVPFWFWLNRAISLFYQFFSFSRVWEKKFFLALKLMKENNIFLISMNFLSFYVAFSFEIACWFFFEEWLLLKISIKVSLSWNFF